MTTREELAILAKDLRAHLEWLREAGQREIPPPPAPERAPAGPVQAELPRANSLRNAVRSAIAPPAAAAVPLSTPPHERPAAPAAPAHRPTPPAAPQPQDLPKAPRMGAARPLDEIRRELGDCRRCKLGPGRKNLVFGVGDPKAKLMFVGEGPGAEEDEQGIPFVGKAGQLLTKMIEAMGFQRDEVYICNVVKCRPPGNRNPEPDEIEACEPFLVAQIASIQPKVIVTLGKFAAQTLLRDPTAISRLRGTWREYCGIRLMPTFHPAYLLRSPAEKKKAWEDLKLVMREFGMKPPAGG